MSDRVQVIKWESPASGGTQTDTVPTEIDPNEDGLDARSLFLQNNSSADSTVEISRDASDNMTFKDGVVSGTKTLADLLSGSDDDQVKDIVPTGEVFIVKEDHQHIVFDELTIDGEYRVIGESVILAGAKDDDDQVEDNVPDGETFTVKENFQHIIYKSFRIAGEYIVRGTSAIIGGDDGGGGAPAAHASTHEDSGSDEIDVSGLSGELADDQPSKAHALGGSKHTSATLAQLNALVSDATLDDSSDTRVPASHSTAHENGGADEIDVTGLSGELADDQPPKDHASSHQNGGGDVIKLDDLATPDDNTDLDATTSVHGLCPKLGGGTTNFLRADGSWVAPSGGGDAETLDGEDGSYYLDHRNFTNLHPINAQTGTTYTLQDSDNGKLVTLDNASAITLTVPSGLSSDFACALLQKGAGNVTISAGSGVTVNNIDNNTTTDGQWALASVTHIGSNVFFTQGRLSS